MNVETIKELIELMKTNELSELEIIDGQSRVTLKRGQDPVAPTMIAGGYPPAMPAAPTAGPPAAAGETGEAAAEASDEHLHKILSPMVGTFYVAPSPTAEPFVAVGDSVGEETVVGIIEAMKVMNEIKAGVAGEIAEIHVENGQPVEFGQPLFSVKP